MATDEPFDKRQVRDFVKQAKHGWGFAWSDLGERFQAALIVERAAYVMAGQAAEKVETATISWLIHAMLVEAGLADPK